MTETEAVPGASSPVSQGLAPVRARAIPDPQQRARRARKRRDSYRKRPWILREVYGAPVWAMLALGLVVVAVAVLYLVTR